MIHLAVDIGNTNIVFGLHKDTWFQVFRVDTKGASKESLTFFVKNKLNSIQDISKATISSVVPEVTNQVVEVLNELLSLSPFLISPEIYSKFEMEIANPDEIGTDLVSNCIAAFSKFEDDCVVVDFGTALTFTVIYQKRIIGVSILPGIKTSLEALIGNASQLSDIPLELTSSVIGRDTKTAIQSGILWGYVGLVERMLERIENEINAPLKKVATGGLSLILPPLRERFNLIDQNLTLEGIRLIGLYNEEMPSISP